MGKVKRMQGRGDGSHWIVAERIYYVATNSVGANFVRPVTVCN